MARDTKGSSLRNRIRVTHKSRLKVLRGNIDAEAAFGEDELNQQNASTAGVDAEDASEHHLQQVLHAAAQRTASSSALTRTRGTNAPPAPEAPQQFIPTPDATGLAIDYEKLYPQNKFTEPVGYIRFSDTVDECQDAGFANGFTYFLDERDCEWLEKNNQAARGEGTSTGAVARPRNAKAKGKEPEPPVPITEDELELVMGVFEKVTEERYPFLHLDVGNIPDLPAFESVFSSPLPASYFASYSVPDTVPTSSHLWRLARLIYPHWRDRKIERQGRRVIPQLNYDESNEGDSYVCFRRRDVKPIRKTRRTDTASVDKLIRLKGEMASAMELATSVVAREVHRREAAQEAQTVWKARLKFVDLKRKYPTLGTAEDDTMLFDKERVVKRSRVESMGTIKIKGPRTSVDSVSAPVEVQKHPRERAAHIQTLIEKEMSRKKEQDYLWEDVTDMPLHAFQVHVNQRHFRTPVQPEIHPQSSHSPTTPERNARPPNVRLRMGRGGRLVLDRRFIRSSAPKQTEPDLSRFLWPYPPQQPLDPVEKQRQEDEAERARRIADMWKFDRDANAEGNGDELERVIVDDFEPRYMKARIGLLSEPDQHVITADCTAISQLTQLDHRNPNSALAKLVLAMKQKQPPTPVSVSVPVNPSAPIPPATAATAALANTQTKLQPPTIPSAVARPTGVRLSSSPSNTTAVTAPLSATPAPMANAVNGAAAKPNGAAYLTPPVHPNAIAIAPDSAPPVRVSSPMRPKSQPQQQPMTNGFPAAANGSFPAFPVNGVYHPQGPQVNGNRAQLNQQQLKSLQAAYAQHQSQGILPLQQQQVALGQLPLPQHYAMPIPGGPMNGGAVSIANINLGLAAQNMQLKLPPRAMQRTNTALGPANMNGVATPVSPVPGHALPRAPNGVGSANGHPIATARGTPMMAAHAHHLAAHSSPHLIPHSSPPHSSQAPIPLPSASPAHQQQQAVGGAGS